jgi:hypothetical protein
MINIAIHIQSFTSHTAAVTGPTAFFYALLKYFTVPAMPHFTFSLFVAGYGKFYVHLTIHPILSKPSWYVIIGLPKPVLRMQGYSEHPRRVKTMPISKDAFEYASRLVSAKHFPADYPVADIVNEFFKTAELVQTSFDQIAADENARQLEIFSRMKI